MQLYQGDCLEVMKEIPDRSIDLVLTDPPYGTTNCEWDVPIDLPQWWSQIKRVAKESAAIIVFSAQPFTTDLIQSNRKMFRYEIIWNKIAPVGFLNAKKMPLHAHENICVFYRKLPTYNPVMWRKLDARLGQVRKNSVRAVQYNEFRRDGFAGRIETGMRYPLDIVKFGNTDRHVAHPTAKPIELMEYLVKTYSNPGDTVLDCFMGSGSTGVACVNTGREFIGIEMDAGYCDIAAQRIQAAQDEMRQERLM